MKRHPLSRRGFLLGAGNLMMGLPLLDVAFNSRRARAQGAAVPTRLVIFMHQEGTVINGAGGTPDRNDWSPQGSDGALTLQPVLAPMQAFANRCTYFSGLWNSGGRIGHTPCGMGVLTANFDPMTEKPLTPSLDQVVANHIATQVSLPRRHLPLALADTDNPYFYTETQILWDGSGNVVPSLINPFSVYADLNPYFTGGMQMPSLTLAERLMQRRGGVLDSVRQQLGALEARLPAEDRIRVQAHAAYIEQLEQELGAIPPTTVPAACGPVTINVPSGWTDNHDAYEPQAADAMIDMAVMAMACDTTRVVTIHFENMQDPSFPGEGVARPLIVDGREFTGWHEQVHDARSSPEGWENLTRGFRFYTRKFTRLLERMDAIMEPNNRTLLENSLVLWVSEFGDGNIHHAAHQPVIVAGGLGGNIPLGRHHVYTDGPQAWSLDTVSAQAGTKVGQLYTNIQNQFGIAGNFAGRPEYAPLNL